MLDVKNYDRTITGLDLYKYLGSPNQIQHQIQTIFLDFQPALALELDNILGFQPALALDLYNILDFQPDLELELNNILNFQPALTLNLNNILII